MVTTAIELANKIRLNPRASLLRGHLEAQLKLSGGLSGFTPHHASQGCPIIQFDEKGNPPRTMGAGGVEIEAKIRESDPILQSIAGRLNAGHTFLQLMFGSKFTPPSESECRLLKEAGRMWANITQGRRNVFVAAIGVLTPNGGYSTGRFYPLASWHLLRFPGSQPL